MKRKTELHPLLVADIEPDVRPFSWPERKPRTDLETLAGEQPQLFTQDQTMLDENILWTLLKRPIAYHRILADITGTVSAGLFLSQCFYWSDKGEDGWFYKSQDEWTEETGMSRHQTDQARRTCRDRNFLLERKEGRPPRMYFKLNVPVILLAMRNIEFAENPQIKIQFAENRQSNLPETDKSLLSENTKHISHVTGATPEEDASAFFEALDQEPEQGDLFPNKIWPKRKVRFKKRPYSKLIASTSAVHMQMYELCFLIKDQQEAQALSKQQIGQIMNTFERLRAAGADLRRLDEFKVWWATTWMSKAKGTGVYQPPRPIQVVENWYIAMDAISKDQRQKPRVAEQQEVVAHDFLAMEMLKRAQERQQQIGGQIDDRRDAAV